jgi:penicillin-insensitive murein DD-endopeptidase
LSSLPVGRRHLIRGVSPKKSVLFRLLLIGICVLPLPASAEESVCFGTPSNGRLEGGVKISEGANFQPYSSLGVTLGRTYVHSKVAKVIAEAYASLSKTRPGTIFVYGESGWSQGGRIKPHRTHQNGLAVDFMVPVRDGTGKSVPLRSGVSNKFGYNIEFDNSGRYEKLSIDFEAIAAHLRALHSAAKEHKVLLARLIVEPKFIPKLHDTKDGEFIKRNITFMSGQAWIRHDEHYHVDFSLPCEPLED